VFFFVSVESGRNLSATDAIYVYFCLTFLLLQGNQLNIGWTKPNPNVGDAELMLKEHEFVNLDSGTKNLFTIIENTVLIK